MNDNDFSVVIAAALPVSFPGRITRSFERPDAPLS
ncbi:hypothetical protein NRB56_43030 [Nocardia sp. RB56]|uniref:Uncharacterized protein n=1 Tax=Nocardia aurantia TaxID=2585199 RepID=A0A7K0DSI3_9NOCA|nr:hypothetical protein [Nocardia aurantia]